MLTPMEQPVREITMEHALSRASAPVARILSNALECREPDFEEGVALAGVSGEDLHALVKAADTLRKIHVGDRVTYVVNRNLNFTNVCFVGCSFCGFSRGAKAKDAYFHSHETLLGKAEEAARRGATELCIQGGLPKDLDGNYYAGLLRILHDRFPDMHLHAYSPMEISYGVEKTGLPLTDHLNALRDAGLGSIPGTAAEILDDTVRRELSPNKLSAARWREIIRAAHGLGIPTTSTMMYGHTESRADWVRHMLTLRTIQKDTGGFTEFVPLGFIHTNTRLYRNGNARAGASREEDVIVHALARVFLGGSIPNLQVSWVKLGFSGALACLNAGANDFSGTLMEESISKSAGADHGESVEPGELRALIRSIGRIPAERTTTYDIRRVFDTPGTEERLPVERMKPPAQMALAAGY